MKRKSGLMLTIAGAGLAGMLTGCGSNTDNAIVSIPTESHFTPSAEFSPENSAPTDTNENKTDSSGVTTRLLALVETEDAAKEIADLYGIELESFSLGVAVYTTDKEPYALIQMGQEKGYPAIEINRQGTLLNN